jgi:hypothetical protein
MEANPLCQLSYGNYIEVDSNGDILERVTCHPPRSQFFQEMLLTNYIAAPTAMIRSAVFSEIGGYDPNCKIEDWSLWLKILKSHPHPGHINHPLAYYRYHGNNFHKNIDAITEESLKILNQYKDEPTYRMAMSLLVSKTIIKSFLVSFRMGLKALRSQFHWRLGLDLLICLARLRGPFRKFKFKYWNFGS